ncbi:MAG: hypothetical protein EZS28_013270 [Streblomastix strix]|uniref:Uncharacterized protein n=1 Tax=Streblomastix strix TaxID=222440 RepID=A0A5J4W8I5_9EUKA|nr:MAG: hypothetical protein EZS28_013270 [Streblomastix strix]
MSTHKFVEMNSLHKLPLSDFITANSTDFDEVDPIMEESLPYMEKVYDIFQHFIMYPNVQLKFAKLNTVYSRYVVQILNLLDTEDQPERETLKAAMRKIYFVIRSSVGFFVQ